MSENKFVSGFTFIKNGLSLGYPFKESIESIEPLCDEIIINVGFDDPNLVEDDGTYQYLIEYFTHPKFKFIKSFWNPDLRTDGLILSEQTNIALKECKGKYCLYIQGDEAVHEDDLTKIHSSVMRMEVDESIQGLVFNYIHFYGDPSIYKYTRNIYRREVRLIRNGIGLVSWKDAQGFRFEDGTKMNAVRVDARVFHYGWARLEQLMDKKNKEFSKLYHEDEDIDFKSKFKYERIWGMKRFRGTHPGVMNDWVEKNSSNTDLFKLKMHFEFKDLSLVFSDFVEALIGYRFGEFKNYKLIEK